MLKCRESWGLSGRLLTLSSASRRQRNTCRRLVTQHTWEVDDKLAGVLHKPPDRDAQCRQLRGGDEQLLHGQWGDTAGEQALWPWQQLREVSPVVTISKLSGWPLSSRSGLRTY